MNEPWHAHMVEHHAAVERRSPRYSRDMEGSHIRGCQTNKKTGTEGTYYVLAFFFRSSRTCKGIYGDSRAAPLGKVAVTREGAYRDFVG